MGKHVLHTSGIMRQKNFKDNFFHTNTSILVSQIGQSERPQQSTKKFTQQNSTEHVDLPGILNTTATVTEY